MRKRIGVLLSGRGSNFEALAEAVRDGRIPDAQIAAAVSNREDAPGLEKGPTAWNSRVAIPSKGLEREEFDRLVVAELRKRNIELVCLAGYMRLLSPYFVDAFPATYSQYPPFTVALVSGPGSTAPGAGTRSEIRRLHRPLCGRKSGCRADHSAGSSSGEG